MISRSSATINLPFRKSSGQAHWARANGPMRILVPKASTFSQISYNKSEILNVSFSYHGLEYYIYFLYTILGPKFTL